MRSSLVLILGLTLFVSCARAGVEIVGFDQEPLSAASEAEAATLVKLALQGSYDVLARSKRQYAVEFVSGAEIGRYFGFNDATADDMMFVGAHFAPDNANPRRYVLYLNRDAIRNQVDGFVAAAGTKFSSLPEEEQQKKRLFALRLQTLMLVAHEGTHAVQMEKSQLAFGERQTDGGYKRIGVDKYDEFGAHVAENALPKLESGKLPKKFEAKIRETSIAQVNESYKKLEPKFLVVQKGIEVEAKAPFAWPGGTTDAKSSFSSFASELVALGGNSGGSAGVTADAAGAEAASADDASADSGETSEAAAAQAELLGDSGLDFSESKLITGEQYGETMAGDPLASPEGSAAAKRVKPAR
ncbi:MAG: hypothetical protein HY814_12430 [Candidatus Riflebacteria bacterium]|nr:hypothetical protein [Candidatus Riflebacteria bacterium]